MLKSTELPNISAFRRKKSLKCKNLPKIYAKKVKQNFLTYNAMIAFNSLWSTFTKAIIL